MIYLSELTNSPYILKVDPASFNFDFSEIQPDIFNVNRTLAFNVAEFFLDDKTLKSITGFYASAYNITPVTDSSGNCLLAVTTTIDSTGDLENPYIEVDMGDGTYKTLPYTEGNDVTIQLDSILSVDTDYSIRFRIVADNYTGPWSSLFSFHTTPSTIVPPSITANQDLGDLIDPKSLSTSLSGFKVYGYDDEWQSTDWQVLDTSGNVVDSGSITDSAVANIVDLSSVAMGYGNDYQLQVKYVGTDGHESAWSTVSFKTATYVIDNLGISTQLNNAQDFSKSVTVNGGQTPDDGNLVVSVGLGSVDYDGYSFTWSIPDYDEDKVSSLSVWIEDTDGNRISTVYSQTVNILNIDIVADDAAVIESANIVTTGESWNTIVQPIVQSNDEGDWADWQLQYSVNEIPVVENGDDYLIASKLPTTKNIYGYKDSALTAEDSYSFELSDSVIKVDETVFNSGATYHTSSTTLSNDNIVIAYQDDSNSNYGTFVIIDKDGNIVKDETVFNSGDTYYVSSTTLSNDNVVITYEDRDNSSYGTFVIIDKDGNTVKGETVFNSGTTYHISCTALSNDNVVIAYRDASNSYYGTFVIIDKDGNTVVNEVVFNPGSTYYTSCTTLSNDNVVIAYQDYDNDYYGTFVIIDKDGNIVVDETVFNPETTYNTSCTTLSNDNVVIAYQDNGNDSYGTFVIIDKDGNTVKDETVFNSGSIYYTSCTTLSNDNVVISYRDDDNNYYGTFVIIDSDGNIVKDATVFNSGATYYPSCTALSNDNVIVSYQDHDNNDYGTFVILENQYKVTGLQSYDYTALYNNPDFYVTDNFNHTSNFISSVLDNTVRVDDNNLTMKTAYSVSDDNEYDIYLNGEFFERATGVVESDNADGVVLETPEIFTMNYLTYTSSTTLSNDNVVIAYRDADNNGYGTFVIIDKDGNIVKDATVFNTGNTNYISCAALSNDNIVIAYQDYDNDNIGTYVIIDNTGNLIDKITFGDIVSYTSVSVLSDDSFAIIYTDNDDSGYAGKYFITNINSDTILDVTEFTSSKIYYTASNSLSNDTIVIVYYDDDNSDSRLVIMDTEGNVLKSRTFYDDNSYGISTSSLSNDNTVISFTDGGEGKFMIIDKDDNVVVDVTVFDSDVSNSNTYSASLSNDYIIICYRSSNYDGNFTIINSDGNIVVNKTVFDPENIYYSSCAVLSNDNINITYADYNAGVGKITKLAYLADTKQNINFNTSNTLPDTIDEIVVTSLPKADTTDISDITANDSSAQIILNQVSETGRWLRFYELNDQSINSSLTFPIQINLWKQP